MKKISIFISLMLIIAFVGQACSRKSGPYIKLDGKYYDEKDLEKENPERYRQIRSNYESRIKSALESFIAGKIFELGAKENGLKNRQEYFRSIEKQVTPPSEEEIKTYYDGLAATHNWKQKPLDAVRGQLTSYLRGQKVSTLVQQERSRLEKKYGYKVGPPPKREKIDIQGEPLLVDSGKTKPEVTVVEFSGFECPFCKRVQATTKKIREKYKGKINWVMKDHPLRINRIDAHLSSNCIYKQSSEKFLEFFERVFSPAEGREIFEKENLGKLAASLSIDMVKYEECLKDPAVAQEIRKDHAEGKAAGVKGVPHFFINGKPLSGAQPFHVFDKSIQEEL